MANFRSFSEIVSSMIQRLGLSQPNLDTKPGTVSRDVFVDPVADQLAKLYSTLSVVAEKQSLATTAGADLDRLSSNFGVTRNTGSSASGIVIFLTNNLAADIPIPNGTIVTSRSGANFRTIGNYVMSSADKNRFAANATRMRRALNVAGLNSTYAIEVPIQAERPGTTGNVSSLQIIRTNIQATLSVINLVATNGGLNRETDSSFRSRILSVFSGANIGTSLGYRNALLGVEGVVDALVVEPGSSLMLRDGTETIALEDGSSRILSSGTGGKVDVYVLGRKVEPLTESYIFNDFSGSGDISDERNDFILGQGNQDNTRTSEERRVIAFREGVLPAQPVDSMISVVGSQSGPLTESFIDENGIKKGNFELQKDLNEDTGGSPFGFDKLHFISGIKSVIAEPIIKGEIFSLDIPSFTDIEVLNGVYSDKVEIGENSDVSTAGSNFLKLRHTPIVKISSVRNNTTGETYSVIDQNLGDDGLNHTGIIEISGRSLPNSSNILSVNYTWRKYYDKNIDFSGGDEYQFKDPSAGDVIDWSQTGGIFEEESLVKKSDDDINYEVELDYDISKIISVYTKDSVTSSLDSTTKPDGSSAIGLSLSTDDEVILNIISIKRVSDGLELYNTEKADGEFASRDIFLPSDSQGIIGDQIIVDYNKLELFDVESSDGSFYKNKVVLPSEGVLEAEGIADTVDATFLSDDPVFVTYIYNSTAIYPSTLLSDMPISGDSDSDTLSSLSGDGSSLSNQPIFYNRSTSLSKNPINRFGPTPLLVGVSGVSSSGKIKILGTSLNVYKLDITAGISVTGNKFDLESDLKTLFETDDLGSQIGIAKIFSVSKLDDNGDVELTYSKLGYSLNNIDYSIGTASLDSTLNNYEFIIPSNETNSEISLTSSDVVRVELCIYNTAESEELFFDTPSNRVSTNRYGRIETISVSSGFRDSIGGLSGAITISSLNQPSLSDQYQLDYEFTSPKEGERITVSYNINKLILDATSEIERVRPITADVLVKEAEQIMIDVSGTILINDDSLNNTDGIIESVSSAVTNLLSTSALGGTVDYSDIIATAAAQNGVDSVNISLFNESGKTGRRPFIRALDNQYISSGVVSFEAVSRNKFRIN